MTRSRDLAELKRRVYSPEATEDDRARYRAALQSHESDAPDAPVATDGPESAEEARPRARRRPRPLLIGIAGLVVAAAVVTALVLLRPMPPPGPAPEELPVTADERSTFINALVIGTDAGIAAYLLTHREPPELSDATSNPDTVEYRGIGQADVVLIKDGGPFGDYVVPGRTTETAVGPSGRATVLLVVAQSGDVGWSLEAGTHPRVTAQRGGFQAAGSLTSATITYSVGSRPDRLRIDVPAGVPWGAAVVYTN